MLALDSCNANVIRTNEKMLKGNPLQEMVATADWATVCSRMSSIRGK